MAFNNSIYHSVFAGKYLGLVHNPDYGTHRALFEVNRDTICNKHIYSFFTKWRNIILRWEKSANKRVWCGFTTKGFSQKSLYIWAPPQCALTAEYEGKDMYFTIIDVEGFTFTEPQPPTNYSEGYNIYVTTSNNPRYSLIEGYEALVGCRFLGIYCGIRASAAVFKVLKNQPTAEAGNLRMRMDFLRQITQQENFPEFGCDKQDNLYILSPPDCACLETLQELQMEIESITFYLDCKVGGHPRNCKPNRVEVRVNVL